MPDQPQDARAAHLAKFPTLRTPDSGGLDNLAAPETQGAVGAYAPRYAENVNPDVTAEQAATAQGRNAPQAAEAPETPRVAGRQQVTPPQPTVQPTPQPANQTPVPPNAASNP